MQMSGPDGTGWSWLRHLVAQLEDTQGTLALTPSLSERKPAAAGEL